jgi:hypothetical protein
MVVWWKRWAVYVPVSDENGPSMREKGHPVFADADGRWWGERVGERCWTRSAARQAALRDDRSTRGMAAFAAALSGGLSGGLPRVEAPTRTARVGLAGESGWYSRSVAGVRVPRWVWVAFALAGLVLPVVLVVVDLVVPAAGVWLLLGATVGAVVGVVAAGWVLRRASGGSQ